jgi:hypothetical protein
MIRTGFGFFALPSRTTLTVLFLAVSAGTAMADGKVTEENMTQQDYRKITDTRSSVENEPPTTPPVPIHDLTKDNEQSIRNHGGAKVISGKDWKNESPEERDAHLRRIKETMPAGSHLVITVPKGDVWLIPFAERDEATGAPPDWKYTQLISNRSIRPWTDEEKARIPESVPRDKKVSQSDRRGVGADTRAAQKAPKEDRW